VRPILKLSLKCGNGCAGSTDCGVSTRKIFFLKYFASSAVRALQAKHKEQFRCPDSSVRDDLFTQTARLHFQHRDALPISADLPATIRRVWAGCPDLSVSLIPTRGP
jgi:hypothetical protein